MIGIGIGLVVATLLLGGNSYRYRNAMDKAQIEEKARSFGMEYPTEQKVILKEEETK